MKKSGGSDPSSGWSFPSGLSYWICGSILLGVCLIPNPLMHSIKRFMSRMFGCDEVTEGIQVPMNREDLFEIISNKGGLRPIPVVYNTNYDVKLWDLIQNLHPFDTSKWGKIHDELNNYFQAKNLNVTTISPKRPISNQELLLVHTDRFIKHITSSRSALAQAAEIPIFHVTPMSILTPLIVNPMRWQVSGSILAANEALTKGWAINIGGGFHHASAHKAEGFCFFADITLIMKILWEKNPEHKFMILDLDAHQGNGYARDVLIEKEKRSQVYIVDFFNPYVYPKDEVAKKVVQKLVPIDSFVDDDGYLVLLQINLTEALDEFKPSLIIYNAGTDCLLGDPLGQLKLTADGIIKRDEYVFQKAKERNIPIVMLTSGGYQPKSATVISASIINLFNKKLIF